MMKPEDIQNALEHIGDDLIESADHAKAATVPPKKHAFAKLKWIPIIAAMLVCAILIGVFLQPKQDILSIETPINAAANANPKRTLQILAKYPLAVSYPTHELYKRDETAFKQALSKWETYRNEQKKLFESANLELDSFFNATMQEMLTNSNGENKVYSPINVYLALSMLAEVTNGNSREQILDLLDVDDIEALRTQVSALWLSHYLEDGNSSLVFGNSIWLNENETYVEEAFQRLADDYFASSYEGNPLDEEY
ncbi:MAG: hypothetical protein IJF33_07600, partial [Clostridia bacterium]|nr:hypothetical protein [Clostridia bacterium]